MSTSLLPFLLKKDFIVGRLADRFSPKTEKIADTQTPTTRSVQGALALAISRKGMATLPPSPIHCQTHYAQVDFVLVPRVLYKTDSDIGWDGIGSAGPSTDKSTPLRILGVGASIMAGWGSADYNGYAIISLLNFVLKISCFID